MIGFVEATDVDGLITAADELLASLVNNPTAHPQKVGVDISQKEVFCEVQIDGTLTDLLSQINADCPTIAKGGSASAGQFSADLSEAPSCPSCKEKLW